MNLQHDRVSTGVAGLDQVLYGGFISRKSYLISGEAGCGKTTLGMHFMQEGLAQGEQVLWIAFGEQVDQLKANSASIGLSLDKVHILDLTPQPDDFSNDDYDIFPPQEVEAPSTTESIRKEVERIKPARVFLDSISQVRCLIKDTYQFRKRIMALINFITSRGATMLIAGAGSGLQEEMDLKLLCEGVIELEKTPEGRYLYVAKFRGSGFLDGQHVFRLSAKGMELFPRLKPGVHGREFSYEPISSGLPNLDEMLHGGLERGTVTLITGPSGVGKTTLSLQFMKEAAARGERSIAYIFEESSGTLLARARAVKIPVDEMQERGTMKVQKVEPLLLTPDELADMVQTEVLQNDTKLVLIDSVAGYRLSLTSRDDLVIHLHALCKYLVNMGVTVILVSEQEKVAGGEYRLTDHGLSYLGDNILFLKYAELDGAIVKTVGVLKKRISDFDKRLRVMDITEDGIKISKPLHGLNGIFRSDLLLLPKDAMGASSSLDYRTLPTDTSDGKSLRQT